MYLPGGVLVEGEVIAVCAVDTLSLTLLGRVGLHQSQGSVGSVAVGDVVLQAVVLIAVFSTGCRDHLQRVATPALLWHKEPAKGTQSPLLGAFLAFHWFFMA